MHSPSHPGEIVGEECLKPLGLSVTGGAKALGGHTEGTEYPCQREAGISPDMAIRLEKAFGSPADRCLRLQMAVELAEERKRESEIAAERLVVGQKQPA